MASLTGQLVAETYKALLKLIDNDILTASEKQITDGFGGGSNVFIDSQGFLRANKYKITNGLATQFLKADGSLDSNAYLTSITGAQVITALGYTPVPTTRTITINGETHNLAADNSWTVGGTAAIWGNITGTLSNQTDLQNALNAKYNNPTGTISQYIRGDGTLATFPTMPGGLPTGGSAGQILSKIDATDYNAQWIDNYATQTKNEVKLGQTLTKGTPVYVSSANGTNMIVSAASNTSEALSSKTFGLLESGGATNDIVKCVTFGLLAGLDTSAASAGDPVWLGPNGTLIYGLVNKPYAPAHLVYIGVVTRVQQNNGEIFVNVQNGFELKEIHDVYIADPANNHGLFYDIADGLWKNKSIATALGYTPQAQLSGTGFVKIAGTTISYDNSTYLTTADAASTYQTLANLSTDLATSATKYPSVNAVIAGLATKQPLDADLTAIAGLAGTAGFLRKTAADTWALVDETYLQTSGGTLTGNLTISSANPKLLLTDTDNNPDYSIQNYNGTFKISDETNSADRFLIYSTGIGYYNGDFKANKLYVEGGLSTQFIKADGTLDSNTYLTAASLDGYLAKSGGTMTGDLNFYTLKTTRVGGNAYIRGSWQGTYWGIGAAATGHTIIIDQVDFSTGAYESITDVNLMLGTRTVVHSGNVATYALPISGGTVTGSITATSFVKSGGLSTEFLMADGSVSTLSSPVTGSGSAGYIAKWNTASSLNSSNIYSDGTSIGISYTTPNKGGYGRTLTGAAFGSASFGFEAVGLSTTNGGLLGGFSIIIANNDSSRLVGSAIQSNLVGTTATNYGADLRFYAKADAGVLGEVARMTSAGLRVYGTIIKDGGTSSQFLMADGSVSTGIANTITGSLTSGYVPKATGANTLGNSIIYDNGTGVGINKSDPLKTLDIAGSFRVTGSDTTNFSSFETAATANRYILGVANTGNSAQVDFRAHGSTYVETLFSNSMTNAVAILGQPASTAVFAVGNYNNGSMVLGTNNIENIRIFPNGNVVINTGISTNAGFKFDVNGTGRFSGDIYYYNGSNLNAIITSGTADKGRMYLYSSGSADIGFQAGGSSWFLNNLGIGTNSPSFYQHGGTNKVIEIQNSGTTANSQSHLVLSSGATSDTGSIGTITWALPNSAGAEKRTAIIQGLIENNSSSVVYGGLGFLVTASGTIQEKMHLWSDGNLTIGNGSLVNSGYKLDVGGTGKFGGDLLVTSAGSTTITNSGTNPIFDFIRTNNATTPAAQINFRTSQSTVKWQVATNQAIGAGFEINEGNATANRFYIAPGGAAAFSSGVTVGGNINVGGHIDLSSTLYLRGNVNYLNAAGNAWNTFLTRNGERFDGYFANTYNSGVLTVAGASTFSSSVTASGFETTSASNGKFGINQNGADDTQYRFFQFSTSGTTYVINTQMGAAGEYDIWQYSGGWRRNFRMTALGAATFASNLTAYTYVGVLNNGAENALLSATSRFADGYDAILQLNNTHTGGCNWNLRSTNNSQGNFGGGKLVFSNQTNGAANATMSLDSVGRVGIGIASPDANLHIIGSKSGTGLSDSFIRLSNSSTQTTIHFDQSGTVKGSIRVDTSGNMILNAVSRSFYFNNDYGTNGTLSFINTGTTFMTITSAVAVTFASSVTATSFFESSDLRLKTLIESNPIIDGIEKLEAKLYEKNGKIELGYFAQDAELIMPYAVTKNEDGFLNLSYREVHTAKIARLEKEVAELKAQLNLN